MAKYELRIKAREMRSSGESVRDIAGKLGISKSTVSLWVRDIILSIEQLETLQNRKLVGGELGRLRSALIQKHNRLKLIKDSAEEGIRVVNKLSYRELLVSGLALYWAEGSKKTREVGFCNSDPNLILFMLGWLGKIFNIPTSELALTVGINQIHKDREEIVKLYWSDLTKIPISQFRKTSFKKVINKKVYSNFSEHYGTLDVEVLKPARFYYKIMGLIEGLAISQGSSMVEHTTHNGEGMGSIPILGTYSK